jgi:hypothetical protein
MAGDAHSNSGGAGGNGDGALPTPLPLTPSEAFIAAQTEVLRQILQTQQQIAQKLQQPVNIPGLNEDGPNAVFSYDKFRAMRPPLFTKAEEPLEADSFIRALEAKFIVFVLPCSLFTKAEEPLEADSFIRALEAKFIVFVLPCSEENKAGFAAHHLRGEALIWWEHFKSMQPQGHQITWAEFKKAFKNTYIPRGHIDTKMRELMHLKQGYDSVYQYAQKFNNLCHYGDYHVDTDKKKDGSTL